MWLECEQSFERGVGAIAFVAVAADFFGADFLASLFIEHGFGDLHGSDFTGEETFLLGAGGALLADQGIFVLGAAADLVALGDDLGGFSHHHVDAGIFLFERRAGIIVANDEADGFNATANRSIGSLGNNLVRRHGDGLQPGGTEAIHSDTGSRHRKTGKQSGDAGDVVALHAMRLTTTENHVFDFRWIEWRSLAQDILDAMGGHVFGTRHVERAPK
jgi:hypothetical protein